MSKPSSIGAFPLYSAPMPYGKPLFSSSSEKQIPSIPCSLSKSAYSASFSTVPSRVHCAQKELISAVAVPSCGLPTCFLLQMSLNESFFFDSVIHEITSA